MITDLTEKEREKVKDAVMIKMQTDGLWTVFQEGDELPTPSINQHTTFDNYLFKQLLVSLGVYDTVSDFVEKSGNGGLIVWWHYCPQFFTGFEHFATILTTAGLTLEAVKEAYSAKFADA